MAAHAAPTHTEQGAEIVAWSKRYTEDPYDQGRTVCRPCGDPFWSLQDWDMSMAPITESALIATMYSPWCSSCGVDILQMLADMADAAQAEHRAAALAACESGSCRCAWDAH
jgi:hypothetical protein